MPKNRGNGVNAFGKVWYQDMIPNLEKAVKLMEQLNKHANNFAGSMNDSNEIMGWINKKTELENKLKQLNVGLSEDQVKAVLKELEATKEIQEVRKNVSKEEKIAAGKANVFNQAGIKSTTDFNINNIGSSIMGNIQARQANKIFDAKLNELRGTTSTGRQGNITANRVAQASKYTADQLEKSSGKFNTAASVIQLAADTFHNAAKLIGNLLWSGLLKQGNVYEDTFEGISVRTGITRSDYYGAQSYLNNRLKNSGLENNIASSEVQKMWSTLVTRGYNWQAAQDNAIETILTNKIVPYLDTTTTYFQELVLQQPVLMKQIRGIGASTMDIVGSNIVATEYLQDMINTMSPVSSLAKQEIGVQYAKQVGTYEAMLNAGYTDYDIGQFYNSQKEILNDPYKVLTSGKLDQQMAILDVLQHGDITNGADIQTALLKSLNETTHWVSGTSNTARLNQSMMGNQLSVAYATIARMANMNKNGIQDFLNSGNRVADQLNESADLTTENYTNDKNQTNKTLQETTLENLMNELAVVNEWMGIWSDVIVTAIKGVGSLITTYLGAKFLGGVGNLLGTKGAAKGLAGILTSNAGFGSVTAALGTGGAIAAGIAAGTLITKGILDGVNYISEKNKKEEETAASNAGVANKADSFGNSAVQTAIESAKRSANSGGFFDTVANGYQKSGLFGLGAAFGWGDSYSAKEKSAWKNQNWKDYNIYKPLSAGIDDRGKYSAADRLAMEIAYALALDEVGMLEGSGIIKSIFGDDIKSKDDLLQLMASAYKNLGVGQRAVISMGQVINSEGIQPYSSRGTGWDGNLADILSTYHQSAKTNGNPEIVEAFDGFKSHRYGLDEVPYDNYLASLHEGEAVLTAATANELRNLVDTYRETTTQSASLDTIIQQQTIDLINKMDEIKTVIQGNGTVNRAVSNSDQQKAVAKIVNSMTHIKSTKSF